MRKNLHGAPASFAACFIILTYSPHGFIGVSAMLLYNFNHPGADDYALCAQGHRPGLLGVDIPKPTASGMPVCFLAASAIFPASELILSLTPVTPRLDTMYKKPSASPAILFILSFEVGATREIKGSPYFLHSGENSSFSS